MSDIQTLPVDSCNCCCPDCENAYGTGYSKEYPSNCATGDNQWVDTEGDSPCECYKCFDCDCSKFNHDGIVYTSTPSCADGSTPDYQYDSATGCNCYGCITCNSCQDCCGAEYVSNYPFCGSGTYVDTCTSPTGDCHSCKPCPDCAASCGTGYTNSYPTADSDHYIDTCRPVQTDECKCYKLGDCCPDGYSTTDPGTCPAGTYLSTSSSNSWMCAGTCYKCETCPDCPTGYSYEEPTCPEGQTPATSTTVCGTCYGQCGCHGTATISAQVDYYVVFNVYSDGTYSVADSQTYTGPGSNGTPAYWNDSIATSGCLTPDHILIGTATFDDKAPGGSRAYSQTFSW